MNKKEDSLQTAYKNEFSNFYDRMPYGSALSLERMLSVMPTPDWRGLIAAGFAWDLGLTGVVVDHEKARADYHKAEDLGLAKEKGGDRITLLEFRYGRHLSTDNYKIPLTDRVRAVYRVLLCILLTSRAEQSSQFEVEYTTGLAYSYRLARIVSSIPYEKDPNRQTKEDRLISAVCEPMEKIMDLYSHPDVGAFKGILESCSGSDPSRNLSLMDHFPQTAHLSQSGRFSQTIADAFLQFLLGVILFDTYRCPIDRNSLVQQVSKDYRRLGVSLMWSAYENGCTAAAIYMTDLLNGSAMGRVLVSEQLVQHHMKDFLSSPSGAEETSGQSDSSGQLNPEQAAKLRKALNAHARGEDRTGKYQALY